MNTLPSSIETSLEEAGFSATEILILKKLFEEDALTLRHIALKTGKSTGVLDQAMKKLLKKGIVMKETINDNPKFVLQSLQSIIRWMEKDMADKQDMMERRHKNFEAFISTLSIDKGRPEMEHFEGDDGLKRAYAKLLESGKEMLVYMPTDVKEEDDPLRDFLVQYFRERRSRGIHQRVIAHDTPLGRRFQSRDMFEYRKTILVKPEVCPMEFHQIIVGDVVACIDHVSLKASFIRYPHLAQSERAFFETLWNHPNREITIQEVEHRFMEGQKPVQANLKTRVVSAFREFILSRKSVAVLAGFAVVAGVMTYGLYSYTRDLNLQRMKDQVRSIAATASSQFNPADLAMLQTEADWRRPEWAKVVGQLRDIRVHNENLLFAYVIRRSQANPEEVEFVADSHSLNPFANADDDKTNDVDVNGDNVITLADLLQWPGQIYKTAPQEAKDALRKSTSSTNEEFYEDHFGRVISGYAPIRDQKENIVAVLAVDMEAKKLGEFTAQVFQPILFFLGIFAIFVIGRFAALNKPLTREILSKLLIKKNALACAFLIALSVFVFQLWNIQKWNTEMRRIAESMESIAVTAAAEMKAEDVNAIHWKSDVSTDSYRTLFKKLNDIRNRNPSVKFAYIMRPTQDVLMWEFVAEADYNENAPQSADYNSDGQFNQADLPAAPGTMYFAGHSKLSKVGLDKSFSEISHDQWGTFVSVSAPIYDETGKPIAILGLDSDLYDSERILQNLTGLHISSDQFILSIKIIAIFLVLFAILLSVAFGWEHRNLMNEIAKQYLQKRNLLITIFIVVAMFGLIIGIRSYGIHQDKHVAGERLKAIAATAATEFNANDIEKIHWAKDMKTEEYQRLFKKLNDVRNKNPGVKYTYILRPTSDPDLFVAVADADTNFTLPYYVQDLNNDGKMDTSDAQMPPGNFMSPVPNYMKFALNKPYYSPKFSSDQWGTYISGYAPIRNDDGKTIAIFGIDILASDIYKSK